MSGTPEFEPGADLLDCLLEKLGAPKEKLTVITLNHDLLTEDAIARSVSRTSFTYPEIDDYDKSRKDCGPIPVYKLHGSINWLANACHGAYATLELAKAYSLPSVLHDDEQMDHDGKRRPLPTMETPRLVVCDRANAVLNALAPDLSRSPLIAYYVAGKQSSENIRKLDTHFRNCLRRVRRLAQADVTVVGVRPMKRLSHKGKEDDPRLYDVLEEAGRLHGEKRYVGGTQDFESAKSWGFTHAGETLEAYVDSC